jgi:hypothetical protein
MPKKKPSASPKSPKKKVREDSRQQYSVRTVEHLKRDLLRVTEMLVDAMEVASEEKMETVEVVYYNYSRDAIDTLSALASCVSRYVGKASGRPPKTSRDEFAMDSSDIDADTL